MKWHESRAKESKETMALGKNGELRNEGRTLLFWICHVNVNL